MNVSELLTNLTQQGIQLSADNDKLRIHSPKGTLTAQLQANIAACKTEILTFLRDNDTCNTATGLSLKTIGRLLGGFYVGDPSANMRSSLQFKPPVIDPQVMAKQIQVTFRPLPKRFHNETILKFREELELKLQSDGVKVVSWEEATRDFCYDLLFPLTKWKKKVTMRVVKADIDAVVDVERPAGLVSRLKSWLAERFYQIYSQFQGNQISVAKITQLIGWAEDNAIQRLEDPTSTQVILLTDIDEKFVDSETPYQQKIALGVDKIVKNFAEIVIGVSDTRISILNMNLSDSLFPREKLDNFVAKSLIPKIYVPIAPLPMSRFEVGSYDPQQSTYAANLQKLSQELSTTGLFPSGFKLSEVIKRKSHRDIVNSIVNGRTGVSYGFVAYAEAPQYIGAIDISEKEWLNLSPIEGFSSNEVRQNASGRRYIKTKIKTEYVYKQIPDIWLVCSRSGANKTDLNLECDILRMGLKNRLCLQLPTGIDPTQVDIKPSYDTYVMVAIALAAALYAPELIKDGAPMIHFHGYPSSEWFEPNEYCAGVENPSVPCGTYESGVFNFLSIHNLASKTANNITLASLIEPDHGTNIITSDLEYLLTRLEAGITQGQIELGGKHFASLT